MEKRRIELIGISLILLSLIIFIIYKNVEKNIIIIEQKQVDTFIENNNNPSKTKDNVDNNKVVNKSFNNYIKEEYLMVLEINKINLKKGLYNINSNKNKVSKNIEILTNSNMPNEDNSTIILASHSGNSKISYFKNLYKLENNDIITLYYNSMKYNYIINKKYEINKTGHLEINKKKNTKTLILITCNANDKTKQLVIESEQYKEE